jgi:hypothetical protein
MHPKRGPSLPPPAIHHAAALPTADSQIRTLPRELVHALQCAGRLQRRAHTAERELRHARRELARSKAEGRQQLDALRIELLATETRCWALEEVCCALVLTIEQAACAEAEEPLACGVSP